ncbi:MAG: GHKL domain-containing protein [Bacteroidia bacterium]|nr:GHKL domain-containing protein [Bacteroidia bacterium]
MKKILYCLVLTIFVLKVFSQDENKRTDSLLAELKKQRENITKCNILNELSKSYKMVNPEEGLKYAEKAYQLSSQIDYKKGIANSYLNKARHYSVLGEYDKTIDFCTKAKDLSVESNDNCDAGLSFMIMGTSYGNLGKFPDALNAFFDALRNFEKCNDQKNKQNIANCYQNIGNIYNATENFAKALNSYDTAITLFSKTKGNEVSMAMNMASKGIIYEKQRQYKKSLEVYDEAEKILTLSKEAVPLAFLKSWKSAALVGLESYDEGIDAANEALKTINEIGDQELKSSTLQVLGYAYLKKGMRSNDEKTMQLGVSTLKNSLEIQKELNSLNGLAKNYLYMAEYYKFKKDYESSLESFSIATKYNDSIFSLKNKQSLQNLEDERTIELRDSEIKLNKLQLEAGKKQKWLFIVGLVLFASIGLLLFYQSRQRKKNNQKLNALNKELDQANKIKMQFFNILNHDLRGPVANLIHFMHLQKESPDLLNEESKQRLQNRTLISAENLLSSMEDILLWSKGQMEHFKPQPVTIKVSALFTDLERHFTSVENINFIFEDKEALNIISDADYLKTIMRNLTSNAIKALEKINGAQIIWKAWSENNKMYLCIIDNGPGATAEKFKALYNENETVGISTGLGLHLIRDLAKAINCTIKVESNMEEGTKFTLTF